MRKNSKKKEKYDNCDKIEKYDDFEKNGKKNISYLPILSTSFLGNLVFHPGVYGWLIFNVILTGNVAPSPWSHSVLHALMF